MIAYKFSSKTGEYVGTVQCQEDPMNPGTFLLPGNCTFEEPPACSAPEIPCWTGNQWTMVEDHRRHLDSTGHYVGGTAYWLPEEGDDWKSEPRYMKELGPLPAGAVKEKPAKPQSEIDKESFEAQISEAKAFLDSTDYAVIKCAEQGLDLESTYPGLKAERQAKRDLINSVEAQAQAMNLSIA